MKILISKGYVIPFESGVIVITHWNVNNDIRYDRVRKTNFVDEKQQLSTDQNNIYSPKRPCIPYQEIIDYLNKKTGKQYRHTTPKTRDLINAWYKEGFSLEDFKWCPGEQRAIRPTISWFVLDLTVICQGQGYGFHHLLYRIKAFWQYF